MQVPQTIEEYIEQYDGPVKEKLEHLYALIKKEVPQATERISWRMPTFYLNGNLIHFAAFKKHIGLYPGADGVSEFLPKLKGYKTSKGAIQFPLDKPMPDELILDIVRFRVKQNSEKK